MAYLISDWERGPPRPLPWIPRPTAMPLVHSRAHLHPRQSRGSMPGCRSAAVPSRRDKTRYCRSRQSRRRSRTATLSQILPPDPMAGAG